MKSKEPRESKTEALVTPSNTTWCQLSWAANLTAQRSAADSAWRGEQQSSWGEPHTLNDVTKMIPSHHTRRADKEPDSWIWSCLTDYNVDAWTRTVDWITASHMQPIRGEYCKTTTNSKKPE